VPQEVSSILGKTVQVELFVQHSKLSILTLWVGWQAGTAFSEGISKSACSNLIQGGFQCLRTTCMKLNGNCMGNRSSNLAFCNWEGLNYHLCLLTNFVTGQVVNWDVKHYNDWPFLQ
jgi:hypothetical protein